MHASQFPHFGAEPPHFGGELPDLLLSFHEHAHAGLQELGDACDNAFTNSGAGIARPTVMAISQDSQPLLMFDCIQWLTEWDKREAARSDTL